MVTQAPRIGQESVILYSPGNQPRVLERGYYNAVVIEVIQQGTGGTIGLTITDSAQSAGGFSAVIDPYGTWTSIKGNKKFLVNGVRPYVSVNVTDPTSGAGPTGNWTVTGTPVFAPSEVGIAAKVTKVFSGSINYTANERVWQAVQGKRFRVLGGVITASVAGLYTLNDDVPSGLSNYIFYAYLVANTPLYFNFGTRGYQAIADHQRLNVENLSGSTATVTVTVWGIEE